MKLSTLRPSVGAPRKHECRRERGPARNLPISVTINNTSDGRGRSSEFCRKYWIWLAIGAKDRDDRRPLWLIKAISHAFTNRGRSHVPRKPRDRCEAPGTSNGQC